MKKLLSILFLATILVACEKNETPQPTSTNPNTIVVPTVKTQLISVNFTNDYFIQKKFTVNGQELIYNNIGANGLLTWELKTGDIITFYIGIPPLLGPNGGQSSDDLSMTVYNNNLLVWTKTGYYPSISYTYKVP